MNAMLALPFMCSLRAKPAKNPVVLLHVFERTWFNDLHKVRYA